MTRTILFIALGGGIGSVLRYLTYVVVQKYYSSIFPLATFIINILGCLLIGILVGLLEKFQMTNSNIKWFLITGFCGGYTTFSAFGFVNVSLIQQNHIPIAFLYIALSVLTGLLAVWTGLYLTK